MEHGASQQPAQAPRALPPSPWVVRFAPLIPAGGTVLDLACGGGRHARFLLARGHRLTLLDRELAGVADLADAAELIAADLEDGSPFPLAGRHFDAVVVTNYLWRPLLPAIVAAGDLLIYETFAAGNARFGRPSNPDFLLRPGELLTAVAGRMRVIAYEDIEVAEPRPAMVQRLCARCD